LAQRSLGGRLDRRGIATAHNRLAVNFFDALIYYAISQGAPGFPTTLRLYELVTFHGTLTCAYFPPFDRMVLCLGKMWREPDYTAHKYRHGDGCYYSFIEAFHLLQQAPEN
jgi:hypothetical protein